MNFFGMKLIDENGKIDEVSFHYICFEKKSCTNWKDIVEIKWNFSESFKSMPYVYFLLYSVYFGIINTSTLQQQKRNINNQ